MFRTSIHDIIEPILDLAGDLRWLSFRSHWNVDILPSMMNLRDRRDEVLKSH